MKFLLVAFTDGNLEPIVRFSDDRLDVFSLKHRLENNSWVCSIYENGVLISGKELPSE
jgi:hypothetical protein